MGLITGTNTTYNIAGQRESLLNDIYNIDPKETPLLSMIGRGQTDAVLHSWQIDGLEAVNTDNVQLEGDEAAFTTPTPSVRVSNVCQISRKTVVTSGTAEAVSKAGRGSEEGYQWALRMAELKLDIEGMISLNQGAVTGGIGTARRMAGLGAWLKSNVNAVTSDNNPTYTSGTPVTARTDATDTTLRALTETIVRSVMQTQYDSGAKARLLLVNPFNRTVFSTFSGLATPFVDATKATPTVIQGSADVMVTDFGSVRVMPHRTGLQRGRDAWFIDPGMLSIDYLRAFTTKRLGETGDNKKKLVTAEYTLRVKNEAGLALAADLISA